MANASTIIKEDMTLEEKLAAIDQAMEQAQAQENAKQPDGSAAPIDPQDFLMCEGCQ